MRLRWFALLAVLLPSVPTAHAGPAASAALSVERHFTTNALDGDLAIRDFYDSLRGSIAYLLGDAESRLRLGVEVEATRHDRAAIEDDRGLRLVAEAYRRLSRRVELRGMASWQALSEGDDLTLGPLAIGTRTASRVLATGTQIGIDLGAGFALRLEGGHKRERRGPTRFQQDIIAPLRLEPDRDRRSLGASLAWTLGQLRLAVSGGIERVDAEIPAASLALHTFGGEVAVAAPGGTAVTVMLAAATLRQTHGAFATTLPLFRLVATLPVTKRVELHGSLAARFDTADSDDPLASWRRRLEVEARLAVTERLAVAAGAFGERKRNLSLGNVERSRGLYVEITHRAARRLALVGRADFSACRCPLLQTRKRTLDAYLGLRTGL